MQNKTAAFFDSVFCLSGAWQSYINENDTSIHSLKHTRTSTQTLAMAVACGNSFTLVATENGDMYSFGVNSHGQLGDGSPDDKYEPHLVSREDSFAAEEIVMLAASGFLSAAVTKQGSLFTWGYRQGIGHRDPGRLSKEHFGNSHVVMVDCGFHNIIVLTASGQVWICGQICPGFSIPPLIDIDAFRLVDPERFNNRKIVMIACGARHMMALDEDGILWTWGDNFFGELCHMTAAGFQNNQRGGTRHPVAMTTTIFGDEKVVHMSGGDFYTMVVTEDGSLWACGNGHWGNLGVGSLAEIFTPERIGGSEMFGGQGVRTTSCGRDHTLILGKDNRMWVTGKMGDGESTCVVPMLIPDTAKFINGNIMTVSAGRRHSAAVMCDGTVYTWGKGTCNSRGKIRPAGLGQPDGDDVPTPSQLNPALFHGACVGHWHSWFNTHPDHAMAAAMSNHTRLGADTQLGNTPSEILYRILGEDMRFKPEYSAGLLALLGLHNRGV